ncbi:MAG: hypothetical protein ACXWKH_18750 [Limisphaerales bacterium]
MEPLTPNPQTMRHVPFSGSSFRLHTFPASGPYRFPVAVKCNPDMIFGKKLQDFLQQNRSTLQQSAGSSRKLQEVETFRRYFLSEADCIDCMRLLC